MYEYLFEQGGSGSDVAQEMKVPSSQNLSEAIGERSSSWWLGLGLAGVAVAFTVARSLGSTAQ
jgi:predicted phosphoribosyltransferase